MKEKSKFIAFILSFLPGLSHVYVGYKERALIFFGLLFGAIVSVAGVSFLARDDAYFILLLFIYPLLWFISMVDAVSLTDNQRAEQVNNPDKSSWFNLRNKKLITVALSMVPGAGHMYLGLQNRGLALMTMFFFSAFLMGWLRMTVFVFLLPVIWFYSLFDAFHLVENNELPQGNNQLPGENSWGFNYHELQSFSWFQKHPQWIGWGLIIMGCFVVFERIISPLLSWQLRGYLQTGIVALLLIGGGIKLLIIGGSEPQAQVDGRENTGENADGNTGEYAVDNRGENAADNAGEA